jgi:heme/copper-type cytochrome/quinol oxidase subunit 4
MRGCLSSLAAQTPGRKWKDVTMENKQTHNVDGLKRGVVTFIALAVLTVIEYFAGVFEWPAILLWLLALVKAGLVLWYFMHLPRVFSSGGGH